MKALSAFLPWVVPHCAGVTDPYAEQAVRDACIEFCERTNIIQTIETQSVSANQPEYDISAPSMQRLVSVLMVTYKNVPLSPVAVEEVRAGAALRAGVDTVVPASTGTPVNFYQRMPGDTAVYLWPVPDAAATEALAVRASFAPTRSATQVEDALYDDWLPTIVCGALSFLLATPGQPFTNLPLVSYYSKQFSDGIASAIGDAKRGATRGALRVQPRAFA